MEPERHESESEALANGLVVPNVDRVHLPDQTPTATARPADTGATVTFPDFSGLALIYNEPITDWRPADPDAPGFQNIGLVALTNNEFLWYTTVVPTSPGSSQTLLGLNAFGFPLYDTPAGHSGGVKFFYGRASVAPDGTVTREGSTMVFELPFSPGGPYAQLDGQSPQTPASFPFNSDSISPYIGWVGNGYTSWGTLLDVAPGGKFLFSGFYYDSAGIPGQSQFPIAMEDHGPGSPLVPLYWCDALFLVTWDGSELVLSAEAQVGLQPAFNEALASTNLYENLFGSGEPPWITGILNTQTSQGHWNEQFSGEVSEFRVAGGWGPWSPINSSLQGACFCGDSILIAVVNVADVMTFGEQIVGHLSGAGFMSSTGYLVTASATDLSMSSGVDITNQLVGTAAFPYEPLSTAQFGLITIPNLQWMKWEAIAESLPFPQFLPAFGVVSSLLVGPDSVRISLDRTGYATALVQIRTAFFDLEGTVQSPVPTSPTPEHWYNGVSNEFGNVTLAPDQFLSGSVDAIPNPGFGRAAGGETATSISPGGFGPPNKVPDVSTNPYYYNVAALGTSVFPAPGFWQPQRHYWTPSSPDEVFGLLYVNSGSSWGVLRSDTGVATFDFLSAGTQVTKPAPVFPAETVSVPLSNSALQSGSGGIYNLTGFNSSLAGNYVLDGLAQTPGGDEFSGFQPFFAEGSVAYSGETVQNSNLKELFEGDFTTVLFPVDFLESTGSPPSSNSVTLQTGQVVFAAPALGSSSLNRGFFLWAGKTGTFNLFNGAAVVRAPATAAPDGIRVHAGDRSHLPDVGSTDSAPVTGGGGGGGGATGGGGTGGGGATGGTGPPHITQMSPPDGTIGVPYFYTFTATGDVPMVWSTSGPLPTGLFLDPPTGQITGTPVSVQSRTFAVTTTNAGGSDTATPITISIAAVVVGTGSFPVAPTGPVSPVAGYRLIFADDFIGGSLDTNLWVPRSSGSGGGLSDPFNPWEQQIYSSNQVTVANSICSLTCIPLAQGGKNYTSGIITTGNSPNNFLMSAAHGGPFFIEARIKVPGDAVGSNPSPFPAYWLSSYRTFGLSSNDNQWTREIDFFEFGLQPRAGQRDQIDSNQFAPPGGYGTGGTKGLQNFNTQLPFDPASGFHTYTVQLNTNGSFTLWIDGNVQWSMDPFPTIDYMGIILNYALGLVPASNFGGDSMQIAYVAVWQDAGVAPGSGFIGGGIASGTVL